MQTGFVPSGDKSSFAFNANPPKEVLMQLINCAILEDNLHEAEHLSQLINHSEDLFLKGVCCNETELNQLLKTEKIDLVFVDINLQEENGIDILKRIPGNFLKVIVTNHPEYALSSYDIDSLHYLIKPVQEDELLKAIDRARSAIKYSVVLPIRPEEDHFYIKYNSKFIKLMNSEVLYVQGERDYVTIFTQKDQMLVLANLKATLSKLPPGLFIRVHKSYVVNTMHISKFDTESIFIGNTTIPIGETYRKTLIPQLLNGKLIER